MTAARARPSPPPEARDTASPSGRTAKTGPRDHGGGPLGVSGGDRPRSQRPEAPDWGVLDAGVLERILVVSPHLDDAALSAALLLLRHPGSVVVTVFAGRPTRYPDPPGPWDAASGFRPGDDVVAIRREEDRRAMALLGAHPLHLDFVEHQYLPPHERPTADVVAAGLAEVLERVRPSALFVPMGLANPDHVTTHEACLMLREKTGGKRCAWFAYEDAGYVHLPGLLAWRIGKLFGSGVWPTPAVVPQSTDLGRKREAIACYASQLSPLEEHHALSARLKANVPEQYWRLAPPPRGWEGLLHLR